MQLATPACPVTRKEVFITGTEPTEFCELHGGRMMTQTPPPSWLSRLFGAGPKPEDAGAAADASTGAKPAGSAPAANAAAPSPPTASSETDNKKPGVIDRFFGIFGGKKTDQNSPNNDSSNQGNPGNQSNPGNPGH